jgi:hypothetical protein
MWVVWGVLMFVGVVFVCGVGIALFFDIRNWLDSRPASALTDRAETRVERAYTEEAPMEHAT